MFDLKFTSKHLIATLALSGCLLGSLPILTWAGGNPGFTLFGGVDRKDILDYYLDFGGRPGQKDRYKLYIPAKKLTQGAKKFFVSYPDYFDGKFDTDDKGNLNPNSIKVRVNGKSLAKKEVYWDKESRFVEIEMAEAVEPNTKVDLVFSNVKNPESGTYYFVCDVQASGDIPLRLYIGTWVVSINR
jgi:hypothetical protein